MESINKRLAVICLICSALIYNPIYAQIVLEDKVPYFKNNALFWNQVDELNSLVIDPLPFGDRESVVVMRFSHGRIVLETIKSFSEIKKDEIVGYSAFKSTPILICRDFIHDEAYKKTSPFIGICEGRRIRLDSLSQRASYPKMVLSEDTTGLFINYYLSKAYEPYLDKTPSFEQERVKSLGNTIRVEYDYYAFRDSLFEERLEQIHRRTFLRHEGLYTNSSVSYDIGVFYGKNGVVFLKYDLCLLRPEIYTPEQTRRFKGVILRDGIIYRLYGPAVNAIFERTNNKKWVEFISLEEGEIEDYYELSYIIEVSDGYPRIYGFWL